MYDPTAFDTVKPKRHKKDLRKRKGRDDLWSKDECETVMRLWREKLSYQAIADHLGRSRASVDRKIQLLKMTDEEREIHHENELIRDAERKNIRKDAILGLDDKEDEDIVLSDYQIVDRAMRRTLEHQTTTALLMGDPLPGYSALDRLRKPAG